MARYVESRVVRKKQKHQWLFVTHHTCKAWKRLKLLVRLSELFVSLIILFHKLMMLLAARLFSLKDNSTEELVFHFPLFNILNRYLHLYG
jgi:hypothetical protein